MLILVEWTILFSAITSYGIMTSLIIGYFKFFKDGDITKLLLQEMSYDEDDHGIIAKLQQLFFNEYICRDLIGINFLTLI